VCEIKTRETFRSRRDYHNVLAHVGADVHPTAGTVMMLLLPCIDGVWQPNHRTASGKRERR
jgi:hypothetical protein